MHRRRTMLQGELRRILVHQLKGLILVRQLRGLVVANETSELLILVLLGTKFVHLSLVDLSAELIQLLTIN